MSAPDDRADKHLPEPLELRSFVTMDFTSLSLGGEQSFRFWNLRMRGGIPRSHAGGGIEQRTNYWRFGFSQPAHQELGPPPGAHLRPFLWEKCKAPEPARAGREPFTEMLLSFRIPGSVYPGTPSSIGIPMSLCVSNGPDASSRVLTGSARQGGLEASSAEDWRQVSAHGFV